MSRVIDAVIQLTDKFTAPMGHTIKAMAEATAEGNRMRKSIANAGKEIQNTGQGVTAAVTMPVIGAEWHLERLLTLKMVLPRCLR